MLKSIALKMLSVAGISENDVYTAKSVGHRGWIVKTLVQRKSTIPVAPFKYTSIEPISQDDHALCDRLMRSYQLAERYSVELSPMWRNNVDTKQITLRKALEAGDTGKLAALLSGMLRSSIMYGIDSGDLYTGKNWRIRSLKLLDDLAFLAEYVGASRTESGQGTIGHAFHEGVGPLIRKIETAIGYSISAPTVGGAYGLRLDSHFLTPSSSEYAYVALRFWDAVKNLGDVAARFPTDKLRIVEIGAGYGGTAAFIDRFSHRMIESYSVLDLPIINVLQGYYLGKVFGPDAVCLYGEQNGGRFRLFPAAALEEIGPSDILLNENSMPEIPEESCLKYLAWAKKNVRAFYSYNHESLTERRSFAVCTVPEMIARSEGFTLYSRNISWLRPGYVEEVYTVD